MPRRVRGIGFGFILENYNSGVPTKRHHTACEQTVLVVVVVVVAAKYFIVPQIYHKTESIVKHKIIL
jgi:hypothetical protein